ncbi:MAG TPA: N-acetyltransferase [Hyphomicrobiales bacterium]|jgi:putative acetyltransferase
MIIRDETLADLPAIRSVVTAAFQDAPHSGGNEAAIVDALREAGALAVSLVAEDEGAVVGHVAFSPVIINGQDIGWYGLGPVAVLPGKRQRGTGEALIKAGLARIEERGARGCVVLGDPAYYRRFGFRSDPDLRFADAPAAYFQRLVIDGEPPSGVVGYHPAFFERR